MPKLRPAPDSWEAKLLWHWKATGADTRSDSSSAAIHSVLSDAIVARDLLPGVRLGEEHLAALFGVSRTPVREALLRLATSQLVVRDSRGLLRVSSVTGEQILEVYAVRVVLEGFAAGTAARVASPVSIGRLQQLNAACTEDVQRGDFVAMARDNLAFHAAIAASTGNHLLNRFVQELHEWLTRFPSTTLSYPGRGDQAVAQHAEIINAILSHDTERAESLAREHMQIAERIRIAMLVDGDPGEELPGA